MRKSRKLASKAVAKKKIKNESELEKDSSTLSFPLDESLLTMIKKESYEESPLPVRKKRKNDLSDYEKMIQNNIADRMQFLQKLGIQEAKLSCEELFIPKQTTTVKKERKLSVRKPSVMRRSQRLQNIPALDYSKPSFEKFEDSLLDLAQEEPTIPDPGPKELSSYYELSDFDSNTDFVENLKGLQVNSSTQPWSGDPEDVKTALKRMETDDYLVRKVVPGRIFSLRFHPTTDKTLVFVGSKYGHLGVWDVHRDEDKSNIFYYKVHCSPINSMTVDKFNLNKLYTCSYDGTLRRLDFKSMMIEELYRCDEDYYVSWHAQKDANCFVVGGSAGFVDLVDLRVSKEAVSHYTFNNPKSVKVVTVHPTDDNLMATASANGAVCLWDVRKMTKNPLSQVSHSRTVSGLEFSPVTGRLLLSTCADNNIRAIEVQSKQLKVINRIPHNNHTGRWLTTFKTRFLPASDDLFVVGSLHWPRQIEIWDTEGALLHTFRDPFLNSVTSINDFHPYKHAVAGGNSSGKVHIFIDKNY